MSDPRPRTDRRRRWAALLRWSRVTHLYCGLALLPWVCLYGATGLLFNHPQLGDDGDVHRFRRSELADRIDPAAPDPSALASRVAARLGPHVTLRDSVEPTFEGSLRARATTAGREVHVSLGATSGRGAVRLSAPASDALPPGLGEPPPLDPDELDAAAWTSTARAIAGAYVDDSEALELTLERAPQLRFEVEIDDQPWTLLYDPKAGRARFLRPEDEDRDVVRLLERVHMTHAYPDGLSARWIHAVFVDLTAAALLLWCVTGLLMWWQMRRRRRTGAVALLLGVGAVVALMTQVLPGMR
ncbi:MAG: hypothetical protein R3A79_25170 [Nannocystaceae bacterium]